MNTVACAGSRTPQVVVSTVWVIVKGIRWEQRYSTVEKELLAIKLATNAFKVYLLGRQFMIITDHRSLEWLDRLKENNARLTMWSLALQPFDYIIKHRPGKENGNADALSRIATN